MNTDRRIILIADNIRSVHNVGSLYRTADAFNVEVIYFTGITPTPKRTGDKRLPHVILRSEKMISKVALGAEKTIKFEYFTKTDDAILSAKKNNFKVIAIEQAKESHVLSQSEFTGINKVAILIGTETVGIEQNIIDMCDKVLEMPMLGQKESLNASVMAGIALFVARIAKE